MINDFIVVFSTEFMRRIKSRPFQLGLVVGILGILAVERLPALLTQNAFGANARIVLAGDPQLVARAKPLLAGDFTVVATPSTTAAPKVADIRDARASAWVTLARNPAGGLRFTVYSNNPKRRLAENVADDLTSLNVSLGTAIPRSRIHQLLQVPYTVTGVSSKFANDAAAEAAYGVGYALLVILYLLILVNSQLVMASVAEEKTSRIAELLVASISPIPLLYGKIAAATAIGLLQMVAWIATAILVGGGPGAHAASVSSDNVDFSGLTSGAISLPELLSFIALFALGFLQFSMLFAGIGSLINRTEDLGSVSMPIIIPVVGGFLAAIATLEMPDAPWAIVMSFVPLISPFVLFARIAVSDVPAGQLAAGLIVNLLAAWFIALMAGKLYRVGMLLYGRPPSLKQVWSVIRS